jgi:polar amino acid transport system ATP-binding protein
MNGGTGPATMIDIDSLVANRSGNRILDGVSLSVVEGTVTTLIGPSGGGKSTLLRCMNGLETFAAGSVTIFGHRLVAGLHAPRDLERIRRDVGMVFQAFNLFPHLSAIDNVTLAPRIVRGVAAPEARRRGLELLDRVGLSSFSEARPATLSGGQQQRVAIARSLAMEPRVMLFDEPTSALDPRMSQEVLDVIIELARAGQTMVVVTHDHAFARRAATQVVELVAGRVTRAGPAAEILAGAAG